MDASLLSAAAEAERFAQALGETALWPEQDSLPIARQPGASRARRWGMALAAGLALASGTAAWLLTRPASVSTPASGSTVLAHAPDHRSHAPAVPGHDEPGFVLAVFSPEGCEPVRIERLGSSCPLQDVDQADLLSAAMAIAGTDHPDDVSFVAVSSPGGTIPRAGSARDLAACLASNAGGCADDGVCAMAFAAECIPPGYIVVADAWMPTR